jgi:hypothetical protein
MPPRDLSIRQRGGSRTDLEAPQSHRALDDVPTRNSFAPRRYNAGPSNPRPAPLSARRPVELPQRSTYPTLQTGAHSNHANPGIPRSSLRPSVSQPLPLVDSVTASASWDLDAAESIALSQLEPSFEGGNGSHGDDDSCSPTASDIEALEESFYEFEIQSSQAEAEYMRSSSQEPRFSSTAATNPSTGTESFQQGIQTASSANYNNYSRTSSSTGDLDQCTTTSGSVRDRLRLVWRMFSFPWLLSFLSFLLLVLIVRFSGKPSSWARQSPARRSMGGDASGTALRC